VHSSGFSSEGVFFGIAIGAGQILILLFQNLVYVQLLHLRARHAERIRERPVLCAQNVYCVRAVNLAYAALMFFEFFVTEAVFSLAKADSWTL